jgi:uncharacterized membrane protein
MQQLVEVALRALSPGINEPFTAITCIDWLGASIRELSSRIIPSDIRNDDAGQPRILAHQMNFQALAHTAFNQISLYGSSNPLVACHLLNVIGSLAPDLRRLNDLRTLTHQVWVIGRSASTISNPQDHQQVESCMHDAIRALALRRCNLTHDEHIRMPARSV